MKLCLQEMRILSLRIPLSLDIMNHNQAVSATSFSLVNEKTLNCANGGCLLMSRGLKLCILYSPFSLSSSEPP